MPTVSSAHTESMTNKTFPAQKFHSSLLTTEQLYELHNIIQTPQKLLATTGPRNKQRSNNDES